MKNVLNKINETGTLLIEAIAMLGLVSMVTPVLYKKAAERSAELQDINASSQLRAIASAMDAYLTDNFAKIVQGSSDVLGADFSDFQLGETETSATISISALKDYLPYGMMSGNNIRDTKLISSATTRLIPSETPGGDPTSEPHGNYQIVVKLNQQFDNGEPVVQTLTGFIIAEPKPGVVNNNRAARIASMVGSNGGYITGNRVNGVQGVWSVAKNDLDSGMQDNTIVISSLQPITSQGLSNEKVLHRVNMQNDVDQELNTMTTDLFMGKTADDTRNIRMVNQIVMMPNAARMVGGTDANIADHNADDGLPANNPADIDNALYIGNRGGANIQGALQAVESLFTVRENLGQNQQAGQGNPVAELRGRGLNDPTFHVGVDNMTYGNPIPGTMRLTVDNGNLVYARTANTGGNGATARESLNVGETTVSAMENTLRVVRGNTTQEGTGNITGSSDGYVTIGTGGSITAQQSANLTPYTWDTNHVATAGDADNGSAVLTVGGSAFVEDTLLGGKVKGFDVEASRLRAGRTSATFDAADSDDDFFMKVLSEGTPGVEDTEDPTNSIPDIAAHNRFILGNEANPFVRAADTVRPGFTVDAQRVNGGIDLISGETALLDANNDVTNDTPQPGKIRLGAENGIFLSTYNANGTGLNLDSAVSIQSDTLQVYQKANGYRTIDAVTRRFYVINNNIVNLADTTDDADGTIATANNTKTNDANDGKYIVEGMEFNVGRREFGNNGTIILTKNDSLNLDDDDDSNYNDNIRETSILNIQPNRYGTSKVTTRLRGGVGFYDHDQLGENRDNPADTNDPAALFIDKGKFEIRSTVDSHPFTVNSSTNSHIVNKGDLILAVDNNMDTERYTAGNSSIANLGSVYIRKGSINLASNRSRLSNSQIANDYSGNQGTQSNGNPNPTAKENMTGYIAADRFISHYANQSSDVAAIKAPSIIAGTDGIASATVLGTNAWTGAPYDKYEVNPAYTSVMHDIKLTTRGGARLSDILPDFINKGIYVVDTDYKEKLNLDNGTIADWANSNFSADTCRGNNNCIAGANDPVSAYVGFVPTPKCPPGYAKVITLTPAGWAMAQAGKLNIKTINNNNRPEVDIYDAATVLETNAQATTNSETAQQPIYLDYQKSTWLRSEVRPVYAGYMNNTHTGDTNPLTPKPANFNGWGLIMGFIYPESQYQNLIAEATATTTTSGVMHGAHGTSSSTATTSETVYWNLFPVYKSEIEGYATVYCYFDRSRSEYNNSSYIDRYNQLDKYNNNGAASVGSHKKGGE
ncbi:MAG: hypothetical protein J6T72_01655, partial [Alphaproteobacteria bacterium]|nr:hypothetical protein [Alphaproteobacteria bacterium]